MGNEFEAIVPVNLMQLMVEFWRTCETLTERDVAFLRFHTEVEQTVEKMQGSQRTFIMIEDTALCYEKEDMNMKIPVSILKVIEQGEQQ